PPPTHTYPLSLHDALPIFLLPALLERLLRSLLVSLFFLPFRKGIELGQRILYILGALFRRRNSLRGLVLILLRVQLEIEETGERSEEHTSELQSLAYLVCR